MSQIHRRFTFPDGCDCRTIVIRETTGIDEQNAALQADARQGRSSIYAELVKLSIVMVDDEKVIQPYHQLEQWSSKSRALVQQAYDAINDIPKEDLAVFLATGEDTSPGQDAPVVRLDPEEGSRTQTTVK